MYHLYPQPVLPQRVVVSGPLVYIIFAWNVICNLWSYTQHALRHLRSVTGGPPPASDEPGVYCGVFGHPSQEHGPEDSRTCRALCRWLNMCMDHHTRDLHMMVTPAELLKDLPSQSELDAARLADSFADDVVAAPRRRETDAGAGGDGKRPRRPRRASAASGSATTSISRP